MSGAETVMDPEPAGTMTVSPLPLVTVTVLLNSPALTVNSIGYLSVRPSLLRLMATVPSHCDSGSTLGVWQVFEPPLNQPCGPFERAPRPLWLPSFLSPYRSPFSVISERMSCSPPKKRSTWVLHFGTSTVRSTERFSLVIVPVSESNLYCGNENCGFGAK